MYGTVTISTMTGGNRVKEFDIIVVGGGPAGYNSAEYAAHHGQSVLLVEKAKLGGTCLNVGCIPTKSLLYASKMYHYANGAGEPYGVTTEHAALDRDRDSPVQRHASFIFAPTYKSARTRSFACWICSSVKFRYTLLSGASLVSAASM